MIETVAWRVLASLVVAILAGRRLRGLHPPPVCSECLAAAAAVSRMRNAFWRYTEVIGEPPVAIADLVAQADMRLAAHLASCPTAADAMWEGLETWVNEQPKAES